MRFSHTKLQTLLNNPVEYFLKYEKGIEPIDKKPALALGSAVHWGLEHETDDLSEYYRGQGDFWTRDNYTRDQALAEAMVAAYLKLKPGIYDAIMGDAKVEAEEHEISIEAPLRSYMFLEEHTFNGIIDLLFLTDKGFVVIDYKTSSVPPDWDKYLDQLYRYVYMLKTLFPEVPIYRMGIVCLRKSAIRQRKDESPESLIDRLKAEYTNHAEEYITYNVFEESMLDEKRIDAYIRNLSHTCDCAQMIVENGMYYCNYSNLESVYGKSDYWDFVYKTEGSYVRYSIKDKGLDDAGNVIDRRTCVDIDFMVLDEKDAVILNTYRRFGDLWGQFMDSGPEKDSIDEFIAFLGKYKDVFVYNRGLLEMYREIWNIGKAEKSNA